MNNIANLRKKNGLTQLSLAQKLNVSRSTVAMWELGKSEPNNDILKEMSKIFNVTINEILSPDSIKFYKEPAKGIRIPVLGYVRAGIPLGAIEEILDYEEITPELAATGEFFGLVIKGDSMDPILQDGDVVIVRQQPDAENGEIVVALVNGDDATVKKFKRIETGLMLIPENREYEPFFYDSKEVESLPVTIIGKVVELRRKF